MRQLSAHQLAQHLGAQLIGSGPDVQLSAVAPLDLASATELSFLHNPSYREQLRHTRAGAVLVSALEAEAVPSHSLALVCDRPYVALAQALALFQPQEAPTAGVHPSAVIAPSARISPSASIGPWVVVEDNADIGAEVSLGAGCYIGAGCRIGAGSQLYPHVVLYGGTCLGQRVILHSGCVLGADGFGFALTQQQHWLKVPQLGHVVVEDEVEIGANSCVDCGTFGSSVVGRGTKIDNLVQLGHNVQVGEHCVIAGCTGVAGSTSIGAYSQIGGAANIIGHLDLPPHLVVSAGATVNKAPQQAMRLSGYPAQRHEDWAKNAAVFRELVQLKRRIQALEQRLEKAE